MQRDVVRLLANTPDAPVMLVNATLVWLPTKSFEDELHTRLESVVTGRALDQFGATLMRLRASNRRVTSHEQIAPAS